jgi:hypothetical protein
LGQVLYQVLIEAPRKINENVVLLNFGVETLLSFVAILIFASCAWHLLQFQYSNRTWRRTDYIIQLLLTSIGILAFTKVGNLSAGIFMVLTPTIIVYYYFKKNSDVPADRKQFFFIMTSYQFVLIPYPNVNFHILIFTIAFFILIRDKLRVADRARAKNLWAFPVILVVLLLFHEARTINTLKTYSFHEVQFKSGATAWNVAIEEAKKSEGKLSNCSTIGCKMLLLISE